MDWNFSPSELEQLTTIVKRRWPKLTDDDARLLGGKKEMFLSRLQQRYGMTEQDAERELSRILSLLDTVPPAHLKSVAPRPEQQHPHK
jgi:uncharacterized protein YjbJ (UPF0337 family)